MITARDSVSFYLCLSALDSVHRVQSAQVTQSRKQFDIFMTHYVSLPVKIQFIDLR